jgi:hypothetical protein
MVPFPFQDLKKCVWKRKMPSKNLWANRKRNKEIALLIICSKELKPNED